MPRLWNPPSVAPPFGKYSQCAEVEAGARLLYVAGQVGVRPDGTLAQGIDAQAEQALANIVAILAANDMGPEHIVKLTTCPIRADFVTPYREARARVLGEHEPPNTLLVVHSLANPEWLIEIEAVAAR